MSVVAMPAAALGWLGRQGTRAVAVSIFLGLAVPQLAATFKPFITESIFFLLTLAFLRVDPSALRELFVRPGLVLAATGWTMLLLPVLLGSLFLLIGLDRHLPGLMLALLLQAAAPPITSSPAFAALMGLEAALSLALLVVATAITPLTAPFFAQLFVGASLEMSPLALGMKLLALLTGATALAVIVHWWRGRLWVEQQKERIDGLNVILLFIFAVALMDGVMARILTEPLLVAGLIVLSFALSLTIIALTTLVFAPVGRPRGFVLGLAAGQRNMGLIVAAAAGAIPDLTWLYFAIAQFPIYLLPQMLKPLARRIGPQ